MISVRISIAHNEVCFDPDYQQLNAAGCEVWGTGSQFGRGLVQRELDVIERDTILLMRHSSCFVTGSASKYRAVEYYDG
jgi:hypothetical protein